MLIQSSNGNLSFNTETGLSEDDFNESKIIPQKEPVPTSTPIVSFR
jgi:hypothetical protein